MQQMEEDVRSVLDRLVSTGVPADMEARILCSCRSRLFETSCTRRRTVVRLAAMCAMANIALGVVALQAHQRHVRPKAILYGG
jgi:hypothetical protein